MASLISSFLHDKLKASSIHLLLNLSVICLIVSSYGHINWCGVVTSTPAATTKDIRTNTLDYL